MTTRGVPSPTTIHFTIDRRHGILKARHIAEALQIPFELEDPSVFRQWSPVSQRDMVRIYLGNIYRFDLSTEGASTWDGPLRCGAMPPTSFPYNIRYIGDELFWTLYSVYQRASTLGPHHLIMVSLIHFEEKVHGKKLQRVDTIPLLFLRLLCQLLEYMGFPTEPWLERCSLCRERSTLDKWN
ncbi:hypothetical protein CK203_098875 [Vitis vinifera]|uniref:Uncharacterized protein n=1 Tax=Vitis vinifera TaxID=29760 RepID=A0A438DDA5_VITVI|nr:hypothetical protein CK203_098875 [Vitis vinifera]